MGPVRTRRGGSLDYITRKRSKGASHRLTVVSFLADPASCLSSSPSCRFLRTRPAVCLVACSISVSHRSPLCRFLLTRPFLARGSWVSLYVEWLYWLSVLVYLWCGAAGSLSTGLLVVWGCWISLYWSIGGVGLLDISLLVYLWCGAAGSLYWSTGGVGLLDLSLLVYWWCGAAGSLSTGLLVVWGCWISLYWSICGVGLLDLSLLVYLWCGAAGSLYWSTGGVGLLVLSTGLLVVWGSQSIGGLDLQI